MLPKCYQRNIHFVTYCNLRSMSLNILYLKREFILTIAHQKIKEKYYKKISYENYYSLSLATETGKVIIIHG